jgi:hypothetical protein
MQEGARFERAALHETTRIKDPAGGTGDDVQLAINEAGERS